MVLAQIPPLFVVTSKYVHGIFTPWPSVLDFWKKKKKSILKLIFAGYTGCKNSVQNRVKIQFVNLIFPTWFFKNQVQMDRSLGLHRLFQMRMIRSFSPSFFKTSFLMGNLEKSGKSLKFHKHVVQYHELLPKHHLVPHHKSSKMQYKVQTSSCTTTNIPMTL